MSAIHTSPNTAAPRPTLSGPVLAGLALALGAPLLIAMAGADRLFGWLEGGAKVAAGELIYWLLAGVLLLLVTRGERRSLATIGIRRPTWRTVGLSVVGAVLLIGILVVVRSVLAGTGLLAQDGAMMALLGSLPAWAVVLLALRAGIVEEIIFRGYAIERLSEATGRTWIAALVSLVVFVAAHMRSWSVGHLIFVAIAGALLTGLYLWRRDLTLTMGVHVLTDLVSLLGAHYAAQAS